MTPTKHPLSWFIERIGKTVVVNDNIYSIVNDTHAEMCFNDQDVYEYRDPHPLTSSILTCNVISCDTCGKVGTTEDLDKEVAAKGFEGEGWKLLMDGTINCGCK